MAYLGRLFDRLGIGGWAVMFAGLAVLAVTVLTPVWAQVQQLDQQRRLLALQAERLEAHVASYRTFADAMDRGDQILLRRLAWLQCRLKPVSALVHTSDGPGADDGQADCDIDRWLEASQPALTPSQLVSPLPDHILLRLTAGHRRLYLSVAGSLLLLTGLWMTGRRAADAQGARLLP